MFQNFGDHHIIPIRPLRLFGDGRGNVRNANIIKPQAVAHKINLIFENVDTKTPRRNLIQNTVQPFIFVYFFLDAINVMINKPDMDDVFFARDVTQKFGSRKILVVDPVKRKFDLSTV